MRQPTTQPPHGYEDMPGRIGAQDGAWSVERGFDWRDDHPRDQSVQRGLRGSLTPWELGERVAYYDEDQYGRTDAFFQMETQRLRAYGSMVVSGIRKIKRRKK